MTGASEYSYIITTPYPEPPATVPRKVKVESYGVHLDFDDKYETMRIINEFKVTMKFI